MFSSNCVLDRWTYRGFRQSCKSSWTSLCQLPLTASLWMEAIPFLFQSVTKLNFSSTYDGRVTTCKVFNHHSMKRAVWRRKSNHIPLDMMHTWVPLRFANWWILIMHQSQWIMHGDAPAQVHSNRLRLLLLAVLGKRHLGPVHCLYLKWVCTGALGYK